MTRVLSNLTGPAWVAFLWVIESWWRGHALDISRRSRCSSTRGCRPNPQPMERIWRKISLYGVMIEADRTIVPPDPLHHLGITPPAARWSYRPRLKRPLTSSLLDMGRTQRLGTGERLTRRCSLTRSLTGFLSCEICSTDDYPRTVRQTRSMLALSASRIPKGLMSIHMARRCAPSMTFRISTDRYF